MTAIITIVLFLLIIGFLVFIHEFGHFAVAKLCGVPVKEFAIGFGPTLIGKHYAGTHYQLKLIPLGGFVALEGEEDTNNPYGFRNQRYRNKVAILLGGIVMNIMFGIIFVGIFLNSNNHQLILPQLSNHSFSNVDEQHQFFPIGINAVADEFYSWEGVEAGDVIISIDGEQFSTVTDFTERIEQLHGQQVDATFANLQNSTLEIRTIEIGSRFNDVYFPLTVVRFTEEPRTADYLSEDDSIVAINGEVFLSFDEFRELLEEVQNTEATFTLLDFETGETTEVVIPVPSAREENEAILDVALARSYGIGFGDILDLTDNVFNYYEFNNSVVTPISLTYDLTIYQIDGIIQLLEDAFDTQDFTDVGQSVGGPVAVVSSVNQVVIIGNFNFLIFLTGLISLSLALFNILPFPALDGGQVTLITIEKLRGKQFEDETVQKINFAGFMFLIFLSILVFVKDLVQFDVFQSVRDVFNGIFGR